MICSVFLLINTSVREEIVLTLFKGDFVAQKNYAVPNRELLVTIENFLQANTLGVQDVEGIATVVGVGSFTSTRIATTVVNTWTYSKNIPILAVQTEEMADLVSLEKKFLQTSPGIFISATYSGEPNIGKGK